MSEKRAVWKGEDGVEVRQCVVGEAAQMPRVGHFDLSEATLHVTDPLTGKVESYKLAGIDLEMNEKLKFGADEREAEIRREEWDEKHRMKEFLEAVREKERAAIDELHLGPKAVEALDKRIAMIGSIYTAEYWGDVEAEAALCGVIGGQVNRIMPNLDGVPLAKVLGSWREFVPTPGGPTPNVAMIARDARSEDPEFDPIEKIVEKPKPEIPDECVPAWVACLRKPWE